jgi:hypothetical protein
MAVFNNILAGAAGSSGDAPAFSLEKSVRLNNDADAHLYKTFASAGNRKTWTWSCWFKLGNATNSYQNIFSNLVGNTNGLYVYFASDILYLADYNLSGGVSINTTRVFRDKLAWYHLVIRYDTTQATEADRVRVYINGVQETLLGTQPNQNVDGWWNNAQLAHIGRQSNNVGIYNFDGYLADIHFIDGQSLAPTSFGEFDVNNVWQAKQFTGTYGNNGYHLFDFANESGVGDDSSGNNNDWTPYNINGSSGTGYGETVTAIAYGGSASAVLSANLQNEIRVATSNYGNYYYTVTFSNPIPINSSVKCRVMCPTGAANMFRIRINDTTDTILPANNTISDLTLNLGGATSLSKLDFRAYSGSNYGADLYYIEVDGNIIYADSVYAESDVLRDVPTNGTQSDTGAGGEVSGNYATLNPLHRADYVTVSDGNLQHYTSTSAWTADTLSRSSFGMTAGKWYWEVTIDTSQYGYVGIAQINETHYYLGADNNSCGYYISNGQFYGGGAQTAQPAVTYTPNAILMFAYDADAKKLWVGQNGTWFSVGYNASGFPLVGDPANGNNPSFTGFGSNGGVYTPAISTYGTVTAKFNFGARPYAYTAPSGFKALCTTNLPTPTIADGSDYFDVVLYSGNGSGSGSQTISGLSFSPDFTWLKSRSSALHHRLFDTVQDPSSALSSNLNGSSDDLSSVFSFTNDGFIVTDDSNVAYNRSGRTYVGWNWDAGTSTVSNTDGSITSSVKANPTAGFSIISYTGTGSAGTIGHSLNAQPHMVIVKNTSTGGYNWKVLHKDLTGFGTYMMSLDSPASETTASASWFNSTAPTSSVISLGSLGAVNALNEDYICYAFTSVNGYSLVSSYQANGSADGTFVYCGFRPRFIIFRGVNYSTDWLMVDTSRDPDNPVTEPLFPNRNYYEGQASTSFEVDILSNGFKLRHGDSNAEGYNYVTYPKHIFYAVAENPFQTNGGLAR